jgi:hypothetical protein
VRLLAREEIGAAPEGERYGTPIKSLKCLG